MISIDLEGWGHFGGTLPSADDLAALPKLEVLILSDSGLTGQLPPGYGNLKQLRELRLGTNALQGPLPEEWAGMEGLRVLHLL